MSDRFDSRTNVYNQNGRIQQLENAIQAINNSSTVIAIKFDNGISFLTLKGETSKLSIQPENGEKIHKIDDHLYVIVSGLTADANELINEMRLEGQRYFYNFDSQIPVEILVDKISRVKQIQTLQGGMRPYGCAFIYMGYDRHQQFSIFTSDPSGNYASWKAIAHGQKEEAITNYISENYQENLTKEKSIEVLIKAIKTSNEDQIPNADKLVIGYMYLNQ